MKNRQKKFAWAMLWLFATISSSTYFAPDPAPLDATGTRIIIMVEEAHNYQGDILRSACEIQKEDPRTDDLVIISHLGLHHSEVVSTQVSQNRQSTLDLRACRNLYISNSCFLI